MNLFHSPQPTANHGSTLISYRSHHFLHPSSDPSPLYASKWGFSVGLEFNSRPRYLLPSLMGSMTRFPSPLCSHNIPFKSRQQLGVTTLICSHCSLTPVCSPMQSWDNFTLHKKTTTPSAVRSSCCCSQRSYTTKPPLWRCPPIDPKVLEDGGDLALLCKGRIFNKGWPNK